MLNRHSMVQGHRDAVLSELLFSQLPYYTIQYILYCTIICEYIPLIYTHSLNLTLINNNYAIMYSGSQTGVCVPLEVHGDTTGLNPPTPQWRFEINYQQ